MLCALGTDFKGNDQWETRHWSRRDEMLWGQKDAAVIRNTWLLGSARVQETTCVLPTTYMYIWNIIWIKRLSSLYEIRAFCTFSLTLLLTPFAVCKSGCICSCHCEWFYNGLQLTCSFVRINHYMTEKHSEKGGWIDVLSDFALQMYLLCSC